MSPIATWRQELERLHGIGFVAPSAPTFLAFRDVMRVSARAAGIEIPWGRRAYFRNAEGKLFTTHVEIESGDVAARGSELRVMRVRSLELLDADSKNELPRAALKAFNRFCTDVSEAYEQLEPYYDSRGGNPVVWQRPLAATSAEHRSSVVGAVPLPRMLWDELGARGIWNCADQDRIRYGSLDVALFIPRVNAERFASKLEHSRRAEVACAAENPASPRKRRTTINATVAKEVARQFLERGEAESREELQARLEKWCNDAGDGAEPPDRTTIWRWSTEVFEEWEAAEPGVRSQRLQQPLQRLQRSQRGQPRHD
jgi:hypothetical protein